ncbi:MAG: putative sugar nucleotidyl transferase [Planctomycetaceae bacterium]
MRIAFYEDGAAADFSPLSILRPVFELVCGQFSLRERIIRTRAVSDWGAFIRPHLAEVFREEEPEAHVNDEAWLTERPTLFINGRWIPGARPIREIRPDEAGVIDDTVVYLTVEPLEAPLLADHHRDAAIARLARTKRLVPADGKLLSRPWDLVEHNSVQLGIDFHERLAASSAPLSPAHATLPAILGPPQDVVIDPAAVVDPFVVLDARKGPIWIEAGAHIGSYTQLEGPCYVGQRSRLLRAHVREGTTIGPECRVGGEVECSILHGYVNKYHLGFLGHSYVCPWVNIGAQSTNSDLRNDYASVRVPIDGTMVDSGKMKVGCFYGDHTKIAIGSLFNTGSAIGVMCQILPSGELLPKYVPSFARVGHGRLQEGDDIEKSLRVIGSGMGRRNCELTSAQERLLRNLHASTRSQREAAIRRDQERHTGDWQSIAPRS